MKWRSGAESSNPLCSTLNLRCRGHCRESIEIRACVARCAIARGPRERLPQPDSRKSAYSSLGAISLSPRIIVDSLYLPLKTGWRFSKNALRASWASSLLKAMRILDSS